jgi:hypothetical protein
MFANQLATRENLGRCYKRALGAIFLRWRPDRQEEQGGELLKDLGRAADKRKHDT